MLIYYIVVLCIRKVCRMSNLILHKEKNHLYKEPLTFIDSLDGSKHILLYYENQNLEERFSLYL